MKKIMIFFFLFLLCSLPKISVNLYRVKIKEITLKQMDFNVFIKAKYRGDFSLELKDVKYEVYINDHYLGKGEYKGPVKFGKRVDTIVSVPATVRYKNLPSFLYSVLLRKKIEYRIEVELKAKYGIIGKKLKFTEKGELKP